MPWFIRTAALALPDCHGPVFGLGHRQQANLSLTWPVSLRVQVGSLEEALGVPPSAQDSFVLLSFGRLSAPTRQVPCQHLVTGGMLVEMSRFETVSSGRFPSFWSALVFVVF